VGTSRWGARFGTWSGQRVAEHLRICWPAPGLAVSSAPGNVGGNGHSAGTAAQAPCLLNYASIRQRSDADGGASGTVVPGSSTVSRTVRFAVAGAGSCPFGPRSG
jgi:hypothetical protein